VSLRLNAGVLPTQVAEWAAAPEAPDVAVASVRIPDKQPVTAGHPVNNPRSPRRTTTSTDRATELRERVSSTRPPPRSTSGER